MKRIKLNEEMESLIQAVDSNLNLAIARFGIKELNFVRTKLPEDSDPRLIELQHLTKTALEEDRDMYFKGCLLYTSPSPRDVEESRMPSSA